MKQKDREPDKPRKSSLRTLILFCVVVAAILVLSLCYRIFILITESKFDGESGFIVAMVQDDGKKANLFAFDPRAGTVATLHVTSTTSLTNAQQLLSVPIEAVIKRKTLPERMEFPLVLSSYRVYDPKKQTDLTVLDTVRLWWMFRSTSERDRVHEQLALPHENEALDTKLSTLFLDTRLEQEKQTIAIVNGTTVRGLGGRLENLLSRIGSSVISITNAHQTVQRSQILYYGKKTYTVERLSRILGYQAVPQEGTNVSDIVIQIGNDEQRTTKF